MVNHFRPCQTPLETGDLLVEKLCISIFEEADVELALTYKIDWSRHPGPRGSEIGSPLQPQAEQHHVFPHFHFSRLLYQD